MLKAKLIFGILFFFLLSGLPVTGADIETDNLIIRDLSGNLNRKKLEKAALKVDSIFKHVIAFWSAEPKIKELGKIVVEFDKPLKNNVSASFFFFREEHGQRVRIVRVNGDYENPHQLAHKLTSALFPNPDILIRNMMGEAAEMRFGNPLSFPMCGFKKEEWVLALEQAGSYIPLADMGTEQSDWGKEIVDNVPTVNDRIKQHTCYLEAGSFGEFLISRYGIPKMKQFYRQSRSKPRPWDEVYGLSLKILENQWIESLHSEYRNKMGNVAFLLKLWKEDPEKACFMAQDKAKDG